MASGKVRVKKIVAGGIALLVLVGALPLMALMLISAPSSLLAQCSALASANAVPDVEYSAQQRAVAKAIIDANPVDDIMLGTVAVAVAWSATGLTSITEGSLVDPFTGEYRDSTIATAAQPIYERVLDLPLWRESTPQALTAWLMGTPTVDMRPQWREAAVIAADVIGLDVQLVLSLEIVDPGCVRTVGLEWDGQYDVVDGWAFPAPIFDRLSSSYGYRRDPFTGELKFHYGEDIAAPCGAPVIAARDGVITMWDENYPGYGTVIEIYHDDGWRTRYAHMFPGTLNFYLGARVRQGDIIATVGSAGRSTGCHLHYEVLTPAGTFINPRLVLGS